VVWQAPPDNLAAEGFPTAVCNSGEGGGDLYNRSASVLWGKDQDGGPMKDSGRWRRPTDGVVHMMHNGWGNVQYTVESFNATERSIRFERGGYQHGRGGGSGAFWVENQLELLDSPGEWYYDADARKLYLWPNVTATATAAATPPPLSAAVLDTVVALNGTRAQPVANVSFEGVGFTRTAPTYLRPHERPISGDWAM
jgi:hypothetical protein